MEQGSRVQMPRRALAEMADTSSPRCCWCSPSPWQDSTHQTLSNRQTPSWLRKCSSDKMKSGQPLASAIKLCGWTAVASTRPAPFPEVCLSNTFNRVQIDLWCLQNLRTSSISAASISPICLPAISAILPWDMGKARQHLRCFAARWSAGVEASMTCLDVQNCHRQHRDLATAV